MADVIKFDFNVPVEVALRFPDARVFPPSDRFPGAEERHMFSTTDGRVMYVSPLTAARIKALRLAQGECFWICKRKDGRVTEYAVSRSAPAPAPRKALPERLYYSPHDLPAEPEAPSEIERQLADSIALVERRKQAQSAPVAAPSAEPAWARALATQTRALIDVYAGAVAYASEQHGNSVKPEDVRAMMTTLFINMSKNGGAAHAA